MSNYDTPSLHLNLPPTSTRQTIAPGHWILRPEVNEAWHWTGKEWKTYKYSPVWFEHYVGDRTNG
jgi:hypothetical protein